MMMMVDVDYLLILIVIEGWELEDGFKVGDVFWVLWM